jgi:TP901 family phage tail tape measure protein
LGGVIEDAGKKTQGLGTRLTDLESTFKKMAAVGTAAFTAVGYGVLNAVKSFETFNLEIERAGAFVGATEEDMEMFRKSAIDAARGTQFSFNEAAVALQNFVGGEIDAQTASEELGGVIDLALVSKIQDLQQAVNIGGIALTVFKDDAMEMSDVIDIMATVAADVTTETDKWATAIVNSAGAAKAAKFSFKDLNVLFAAMSRGGADVNLMWSAFNSAMSQIQGPGSKQMHGALNDVGLSLEGLKESLQGGPIELLEYLRQGFEKANETGEGFAFLTQTIGAQAAPEFALALGLTNEELNETAGYFEDIAGTGAAMTERIREAIPATELLKQTMQELNLTLGQALEPAIRAISEALTPVIVSIGEWMTQNPELTRLIVMATLAVAGLVAVAGILGLLLPTIIAGFTLLMGPIGLVIAIIGTLIWTIKNVVGILDILLNHSDEVWAGIKIIFKEAVDWILDHTLRPLMEWIDKVASALSSVVSKREAVSSLDFPSTPAMLPARALGGPVTAGMPYMVGERGPELFVPRGSGTIVPNGAGGGGVVVNVYGDVSGRELVERVQEAIMQSMRNNVKMAL